MIQDVPQVDQDRDADGKNCEDAVHFGSPSAGHEDAGSDEPGPPCQCELAKIDREGVDRKHVVWLTDNEASGTGYKNKWSKP